MKIFKWVIVLFFAALVSSCIFNPPSPENTNNNLETDLHEFLTLLKASGNYEISEDELEIQITQLLNNQEFSGRSAVSGEKTVITGSRKISVSEHSKSSRSAAENEESLVNVYVFNTENTEGTEGYVIASNDMRLGIVLAMVDGGSLEDEPEWWNDIVFDGLGNYIDYTIGLYNDIDDEEIQQILGNPVPMSDNRSVSPGGGSNGGDSKGFWGKGLTHHFDPNAADLQKAEWSWTEGYEARGTDSNGNPVTTNWHQGYPYNLFVCDDKKSAEANDYVTGCWPVAMAQLMAIWGKPAYSKIDPAFNYNWTFMRKDIFNSNTSGVIGVSYLMYELGRHASSEYKKRVGGNKASTFTKNDNIIACLKKMGYKTPGGFSSYSFSAVKSSIMAGRPVLAVASADDPTFLGIPLSNSKGHAWLIDGVRKMTYKEHLQDGRVWNWIDWDFVFCNVGWYPAKFNAWYASGIFDFREGLQSKVPRGVTADYYQYRREILPNVYY